MQSYCPTIRLAVALVFLFGVQGFAQTPWETAPAKPAVLPPAVGQKNVASLPPPPPQSKISSPPHVSLTLGIGEKEKAATPTASNPKILPPKTIELGPPQILPDLGLPGATPTTPPRTNQSLARPGSGLSANLGLPPNLAPAPNRRLEVGPPKAEHMYKPMPELPAYPKPTLGSNSPVADSLPGTNSMQSNRYPPTGAAPPPETSNQSPTDLANIGTPAATRSQQATSMPMFGISNPQEQKPPRDPPVVGTFPSTNSTGALAGYSRQSPGAAASNGPMQVQPNAAKMLESGTLIAVVGEEHILAGDLASYVEPIIEQNRDRIRGESQEQQVREQIIRQVLKSYVQTKAMYQEFFRDAAGSATPDKIEEMKTQVLPRAGQIFFEKQVPVMQEKYKAKDMAELEEKLREKSMSLASMRSTFVEQVLASELERKYVPKKFESTRDELVEYYQENKSDWNEPARARWQQLTIRLDKHDYDREVATKLLHQLGNQVYLGGKRFEEVAKQSSEGYTASEGGIYDWTSQGSLKSETLDAALFSLPLNELSQVISDDIGVHIIRVLERTEARVKPFVESQSEIRESISDQKRSDEIKKFRKRVMARTPIWTRWPSDLKEIADHARPLSTALEQQDEAEWRGSVSLTR
ncbi:MAG: peptidylprolyl isomerase [Planctomycetota bacterium]